MLWYKSFIGLSLERQNYSQINYAGYPKRAPINLIPDRTIVFCVCHTGSGKPILKCDGSIAHKPIDLKVFLWPTSTWYPIFSAQKKAATVTPSPQTLSPRVGALPM